MQRKTINKSIVLNAPKERVWNILFDTTLSRIWYNEFGVGSHIETDWQIGSRLVMTDDTGTGLVGKVIENKLWETMSLEYEGIVIDGLEDRQSEYALPIIGNKETYCLQERGDVTLLYIRCDMADAFFEAMSLAWDRALQKIIELSTDGRNF